MQYLLGLRALGHDVTYVEDCGPESWVYNWQTQELTTDIAYPAAYVADCLDGIGLAGHWIYRAGDLSAGLSIREFEHRCAQADLFLIRAVPLATWRREYDLPRRRAFIDVDPGFIQLRLLNGDKELCE